MAKTSKTYYTLAASFQRDGLTLGCTQPEVLADSYGIAYQTREEAEAAAEAEREGIAESDLDQTTVVEVVEHVARYEVQPVTEDLIPTGEPRALYQTVADARHAASGVGPSGGIVRDLETGMVDVGRGWVPEADLAAHVAAEFPDED